jgi:hypothetical protein
MQREEALLRNSVALTFFFLRVRVTLRLFCFVSFSACFVLVNRELNAYKYAKGSLLL